MSELVLQSLTKGFRDLFNLRILLSLLLIPIALFFLVGVLLFVFFSPLREFLITFLDQTMFATAILWTSKWFVNDPTLVFGFIMGILVFIFALPVGVVLVTLVFSVITPIFILKEIHRKDYPQLQRFRDVSVWKSFWNSLKASLIYLFLWLVCLPLFFFPPVFLIASHLLTGYLNARVFSYDVLSEFLPPNRVKEFKRTHRNQFFSLGVVTSLIYDVPFLNLIGIAYIALSFTHYGLGLIARESQGQLRS